MQLLVVPKAIIVSIDAILMSVPVDLLLLGAFFMSLEATFVSIMADILIREPALKVKEKKGTKKEDRCRDKAWDIYPGLAIWTGL